METLPRHAQGKKRQVRRPKFLAGVPPTRDRAPGFLARAFVPDDAPTPADLPAPETAPMSFASPAPEPAAPVDDEPLVAEAPPGPAPVVPKVTPAASPPANPASVSTTPLPTPTTPTPAAASPMAHDRSLERIQAALEVLRRTGETLAEQARSDALEIGLEVARHIIGQELRTNVEPILRLVREAVRHAGTTRQVTVRLCPDHAERVADALADDRTAQLSVAEVSVVADPELSPGDVEVETEFGYVDGRLNRRFDDLRQRLASGQRQSEGNR